MCILNDNTSYEESLGESYNDILLIKLISFKNNYENQIENYLKNIYNIDQDLKLFLEKTELYEVDQIMLNWYFSEAESVFEKFSMDMLINDITEKSYLQINDIIEGLTRVFDILWRREKEDKLNDVYKWIMDVPYLLQKKIGEIQLEKRLQEKNRTSINYHQNSYENFHEFIEGDMILVA